MWGINPLVLSELGGPVVALTYSQLAWHVGKSETDAVK